MFFHDIVCLQKPLKDIQTRGFGNLKDFCRKNLWKMDEMVQKPSKPSHSKLNRFQIYSFFDTLMGPVPFQPLHPLRWFCGFAVPWPGGGDEGVAKSEIDRRVVLRRGPR